MQSAGRKFSAVVVVGLFIVGIFVGAVGVYGLTNGSGSTASGANGSGLSGTITLGGLVDETGSLSTGIRTVTAYNLAINDINAWLNSTGNPNNIKFAINIEDTASDPTVALQKMQSLAATGVQVFIGPSTSGEVSNFLSYANANHLVDIGTTTSETLAVPGYIFHAAPLDDLETNALASLIAQKGYTAVVMIYRADSWGIPFSHDFTTAYTALGGKVLDNISYVPTTTGTIDFTNQLTVLQKDYNSGVTTYGSGKVAVVGLAFGEMAVILNQAANYPPLLNAQWFTDDSPVQQAVVVQSAGAQVIQTKMLGTIWTPTTSAKTLAFDAAYKAIVGSNPSAFTSAGYDSVWLAALAILAAGKYDGAAVKAALPGVSDTYYGVTGWINFNANGDRGVSDYAIWEANPVNGSAVFQQVGVWSYATSQITYNSLVRN